MATNHQGWTFPRLVIAKRLSKGEAHLRVLRLELNMSAGSLTHCLAAMVTLGWVADRWDTPEVGKQGGARHYHRLTELGRIELERVLTELSA